MARQRSDHQDAIRITTAVTSPEADLRARQKRYLLSMSLRTICFVGAILASLAGIHWLWPILIGGALVLPYIAVVMANAAAPREDGFSLTGPPRPELGAGQGADPRAVHTSAPRDGGRG